MNGHAQAPPLSCAQAISQPGRSPCSLCFTHVVRLTCLGQFPAPAITLRHANVPTAIPVDLQASPLAAWSLHVAFLQHGPSAQTSTCPGLAPYASLHLLPHASSALPPSHGSKTVITPRRFSPNPSIPLIDRVNARPALVFPRITPRPQWPSSSADTSPDIQLEPLVRPFPGHRLPVDVNSMTWTLSPTPSTAEQPLRRSFPQPQPLGWLALSPLLSTCRHRHQPQLKAVTYATLQLGSDDHLTSSLAYGRVRTPQSVAIKAFTLLDQKVGGFWLENCYKKRRFLWGLFIKGATVT